MLCHLCIRCLDERSHKARFLLAFADNSLQLLVRLGVRLCQCLRRPYDHRDYLFARRRMERQVLRLELLCIVECVGANPGAKWHGRALIGEMTA